MAARFVGDEFVRQTSSARSWGSASLRRNMREIWINTPDVFQRNSTMQIADDEEELKWAAIERLPTYDRQRKGILTEVRHDRVIHND